MGILLRLFDLIIIQRKAQLMHQVPRTALNAQEPPAGRAAVTHRHRWSLLIFPDTRLDSRGKIIPALFGFRT